MLHAVRTPNIPYSLTFREEAFSETKLPVLGLLGNPQTYEETSTYLSFQFN
jgi:hypothetical protein